MSMSILSTTSFTLISYLLICANAADPLIETKYGYVLGSRAVSRNNRSFLSFRGIPYAKPPVGDLRFKPPEPPSAWNSPLNATAEGPVCIQLEAYGSKAGQIKGQEDCLYLNIYVPELNKSDELLPVMVFIHGGGLTGGSGASTLYGPENIMDKNVIFITMNYRLGMFGLLSTVDDVAPGNVVFKDQVMALKFVNEIIDSFGGDKTKITLFGQSAGSMSVYLHLVSPLSKGLFQQAICQSSTLLTMFDENENEMHLIQTNALAKAVGCKEYIGDSKKLVECLRGVEAHSIAEAQNVIQIYMLETRTESNPEPFLEKSPKEYIKNGEFQKIPWIVGVTQDDGIVLSAALLRQKELLDNLNANFNQTIMTMLMLEPSVIDTSKIDDLLQNITDFYLNGDTFIDVENRNRVQGFINIFTDRNYVYATSQSIILQYLHGTNDTWVYDFGYRGRNSYVDLYAGTTDDIDFDWGVAHCDELPYIFNMTDEVYGKTIDGTDLAISEDLITLWTNFAIFGDPDPSQNYNWKKVSFNRTEDVSSTNLNFLNITGKYGTLPEYNLEYGFFSERVEFWEQQEIYENVF